LPPYQCPQVLPGPVVWDDATIFAQPGSSKDCWTGDSHASTSGGICSDPLSDAKNAWKVPGKNSFTFNDFLHGSIYLFVY
jgi:hypothetical protein